jgi:HlyD family secretion protein
VKKLKHYWPGILAALLIAAASWMIYEKLHPKTLPENLVMGVGRFDGDLIRLNAKYPGRVVEQRAEEGKAVKRGETLTLLDSAEERAKLRRLEAQVAAKERELLAKRTELAIARRTIPLALTKAQARLTAARAALEGVEKELVAQRSVVAQDRRDYERTKNLYAKRLVQK